MAAPKKIGQQTVWFQNPPVILSTATVAGQKEGQGPLGKTFDKVIEDNYYGEKSWERAEQRMLEEAMQMAIQKAALTPQSLDYILAGDLLNQITTANFTARNLGVPFIGIYGACATVFEGMALGAMLIDGGFADYVLIGTSSHYATAERQYRFPTEQGVQRPLHTFWTVTGAAALVLARQGNGPAVTNVTIGRVVDLGQKDPTDLGAAMAPAAVDTMAQHLLDTGRQSDYYDLFITGDLGIYGRELAVKLMQQRGYDISKRYKDCGAIIYGPEQDAHAGGSGCACLGLVFCGYFMKELLGGQLKRLLGVGTGALFSPCSTLQGDTIPCIGHATVIER